MRSHCVHAPGGAVVPAERFGATAGHGGSAHGGGGEAADLDTDAIPGVCGQGGDRVELAKFVKIKERHRETVRASLDHSSDRAMKKPPGLRLPRG
jgi:hypothetical protein